MTTSKPDVGFQPAYTATIRHMRAFLSVAKYRSFTRAATELRLSQPSLTMTIKQLEDIVGGSLFDRTTRNVILTSEGEDLVPVALQLVADFDLAIRNIRLTASKRHKYIRLAVVSSLTTNVLPRILESFLETHPGLRVQLREGSSNEVRRLVQRNEVDIGLASKDGDDADLVFNPLFRDQLGLLLRHDNPLMARAQDGCLAWSDLKEFDFVGLTHDTATGTILSQIPNLPESIRVPKFEVSTYSTLRIMIERGFGVTTAPALAAELLGESEITFLGLRDPTTWRQVYLILRLGRQLTPVSRQLLQAIEQELRNIAKNHPRIEVTIRTRDPNKSST